MKKGRQVPCFKILRSLGFIRPGPYFIKVKIFLKSGFKTNWSSYVLANSLNFEFLLTLMLILFTIS